MLLFAGVNQGTRSTDGGKWRLPQIKAAINSFPEVVGSVLPEKWQ